MVSITVLAGQLNVNVIGFLMMQKQLDEWHVIVRESGVTAGESSVTIRRLADGRVIEADVFNSASAGMELINRLEQLVEGHG